jgi:hypothetical protein
MIDWEMAEEMKGVALAMSLAFASGLLFGWTLPTPANIVDWLKGKTNGVPASLRESFHDDSF